MDAEVHAKNSARRYGGSYHDYLYVHKFMDQCKAELGDVRHRLITHNAWFISLAERILGSNLEVNGGRTVVPMRAILEDHVREDMGGHLPTLAENFQAITPEMIAGECGVFAAIQRHMEKA